jgi:SSS family solute:Na+ symporter
MGGNYNMALPLMLLHFYPTGLLGIGITALLASFMSGMAGNVTAFNTVWTYDLYQTYLAPGRSDRHYLRVGRLVTIVGILISIAAAYAGRAFPSIFDYWALVSTIFVAAPFATFVLGVFTRHIGGTAAFIGMLTGILATTCHFALYHFGCLSYPSDLLMDFYGGFYGFSLNMVVTLIASWIETPPAGRDLEGLVYWDQKGQPFSRTSGALALAALTLAVVLNVLYW